MRRLVPITAALALAALSCGGSAEDTSIASSPGAQDAVTTESGVVDGTEVAAATGGTVTSDDGGLVVEIPAGALTEDTAISITRLDPADWPEEFSDAEVVGDVYDLQPSGLTFAEPVTISHRITEADAGLDFDVEIPLSLMVVMSDDGVGEIAADQVVTRDGDDLVHTAAVDHFSFTALFGGLVTAKFTPDHVEYPVPREFEALLKLKVTSSADTGFSLADLIAKVEMAPVAEASVELLSGGAFASVGGSDFDAIDFGYICSKPGQGIFGVLLRVIVGSVEQDSRQAPKSFSDLAPFVVPQAVRIPDSVSVALMTGTALCKEQPSSPSAGSTEEITTTFSPADSAPANCGPGFTETLTLEFGEDGTGTLYIEGETEGFPFTTTDNVVLAVRESDLGDGTLVVERIELDLAAGTGTDVFEVTPAELDASCLYDLEFLPVTSDGSGFEKDGDDSSEQSTTGG